jgi:hypothetical protein
MFIVSIFQSFKPFLLALKLPPGEGMTARKMIAPKTPQIYFHDCLNFKLGSIVKKFKLFM